jgi:hypothetical protein
MHPSRSPAACIANQNVFGNAVTEVFLVWIAGQVCEGQDGD